MKSILCKQAPTQLGIMLVPPQKNLRDIAPVSIKEGDYRGGIIYRVKLGPFDDEYRAGKVLDEVAMMGFGDAIVIGK